MLWGVKSSNDDVLNKAGPLGHVQAELLFLKNSSGFTLDKRWPFPLGISFNGDNCVMPPPEAYPWLPNGNSSHFNVNNSTMPHQDSNSAPVISLLLPPMAFLVSLVFFLLAQA